MDNCVKQGTDWVERQVVTLSAGERIPFCGNEMLERKTRASE